MLAFLLSCVFITQDDLDGRFVDPDTLDLDGDGVLAAEDCDDTDPEVFPGQEEIPNQIDDDCDGAVDEGTIFADDDGDGFCESSPCAADCGLSDCSGDCDDDEPVVYPGAPELCDGLSNDCNFEGDEHDDRDGDGYSLAEGDPDDLDRVSIPTDITSIRASMVCNIARVEAGTFTMGCEQAWCSFEEQPLHEVTITRDLLVMDTEVLRFQWERFAGPRNWAFPECGESCPVTRVSWTDAQHFANVINASLELPLCELTADPNTCEGWRLPTESEWEWLARGTSQDRYAGGTNASLVGWIDDNAAGSVHPARLKLPNALGIYDLTGNVWEWTWDAEHTYPFTPVTDPVWLEAEDSEDAGLRILRGASARTPADYAHVTARANMDENHEFYADTGDDSIDHNPENPYNYHGFRLVRFAP